MRSVIYQTVVLPASAETLFDMYLDPAEHGAFTDKPVVIGQAGGSEFQAFEGMLSGTMLQVVRPQLIVQSWRSVAFHDGNPDSTLILSFAPDGDNGRIGLVHVDVPEHDYDGGTWLRLPVGASHPIPDDIRLRPACEAFRLSPA